jgi:carboxymethylenebutenolidase
MRWNSFDTATCWRISAGVATFPDLDGKDMHAYTVRPEGSATPRPGVLVVHHAPGWDEYTQEFAERLGRHGYSVISPDLYCQFGHGRSDDVAAFARSQGGVSDDAVMEICRAATVWLRALPESNGKVAVVGACSGGRHAVLFGSKFQEVDAIVDLWGGRIIMADDELTPTRPAAPITYIADMTAPLLGIFGNDDTSPTPVMVDLHEQALRAHGKRYEFHRFDGAGHGFFNYHNAMYRQSQAMEAWEIMLHFLAETLASSDAGT